MWATIVAASIANALGVAFPVLGALIAKRELGGAGAWALILAAQGVGALVAGAVLLRVVPRRPLLVATLIGLLPALPTAAVGRSDAAGADRRRCTRCPASAGMVFNTLWETTLQQHIPAAARSRVSSYDWFGSLALQSLGFALIGPFAAAVGTSTALYLCGAVDIIVVAALLMIRDVRTLSSLPPRRSGSTAGGQQAQPRSAAPLVRAKEQQRAEET